MPVGVSVFTAGVGVGVSLCGVVPVAGVLACVFTFMFVFRVSVSGSLCSNLSLVAAGTGAAVVGWETAGLLRTDRGIASSMFAAPSTLPARSSAWVMTSLDTKGKISLSCRTCSGF